MKSPDDGSHERTSSRAVLAALRALQDKIRRLEGERAEAVEAARRSKAQVRELTLAAEEDASKRSLDSQMRGAYERVCAENAVLQRRLAEAEEALKRRDDAVERATARRADADAKAAATAGKCEALEEELRRVTHRLDQAQATWRASKEQEVVHHHMKPSPRKQQPAATMTDEALDDEEDSILRTLVDTNQRLVDQLSAHEMEDDDDDDDDEEDIEARPAVRAAGHVRSKARKQQGRSAPPSDAQKGPTRTTKKKAAASGGVVDDILHAYLTAHRESLKKTSSRRVVKPPPVKKKKQQQQAPSPPRAPMRKKKKAPPLLEATEIPWVPSSTNDATSFNLMAAVSYALKRSHEPDHIRLSADSVNDIYS